MLFLFIDFYFQNGELVGLGNGFNLWDLFNVIVGSLIGFGGAFYIFNRTTQAARKRDEAIRQQSLLDKSYYFKSLLKEVPLIIKEQANNYEEFAKQVEQEKLKIHIPKLALYTPLLRLVEVSQNEFFFHAYINQYAIDEREEATKDFERIYSRLDYYHQLLQQSLESLKILRARKREAMEAFRNKLKYIEDYTAGLLINRNLKQTHNLYLNSLSNLFHTYIPAKAQNYTNFEFFYNEFLTPVLRFSIAVGNNPPQEIRVLLQLLKDARQTYTHIEYHSNDEASEFKEYTKALKDGLEDFEKWVTKVQE